MIKPFKPTRPQGLQYVIEGQYQTKDGEFSAGGTVLAMYKQNNHISFGAGISYMEGSSFFYKRKEYNEKYWLDLDNYFSVLMRGKYTLTEGRVAPFASVDFGVHFVSPGEEDGEYGNPKTNKTMLYVTPAVGVSFQVAGNSWIDLKAGYEICPSTVKNTDNFSGGSSCLAIGISFTHTTKLFSEGLFK